MALQDKYSAGMVAACKKALDAGIFYEDAFQEFVKTEMGGPDFQPVCMEKGDVDADDNQTQREILNRVKEKVLAAPRGTYALARLVAAGQPPRYQSFMNDGTNFVRHEYYSSEPTEENIVGAMFGMDIYRCRKAIEADQMRAKEVVAFNMLQLAVRQVYKNFDENGTKFSSVAITQVFPEFGEVQVQLKKRGSPKTWGNRIGAIRLATGLKLPHTRIMMQQAVETATTSDETTDLFADLEDPNAFSADDQENEEAPAPR